MARDVKFAKSIIMKTSLTVFLILIFNCTHAQISNTGLLISFEDNMGSFYEDYIKIDTSTNNIWQIGTPNKSIINFNGAAISQQKGIVTDTFLPYPTNAYSSFIFTVPFQFMGNDDVNSIFKCQCDYTVLSFHSKYDTDTLTDGGTIEISYDGGQNWINAVHDPIYDEGNLIYDPNGFVQSLNAPGYSGISKDVSFLSNWIHHEKYWYWIFNPNIITPDSIMIKFLFASDSIQNNRGGWLLEDLFIAIGTLIGVEEIKVEEKVSVFPNPASSILSIKAREDFSFHIYIYDINAKLVLDKEIISGIDLYIQSLPDGIYNIVIETPTNRYAKKFVKHF